MDYPTDFFRLGWPICLMALLIAGCSFDYTPTTLHEELTAGVPKTLLRNVEHTVVRDGRISAILHLEQVKSYNESSVVILSGIYFQKLDSNGEISTEAWAKTGEYDTESGDAQAAGSVMVSSKLEDARIIAEGLRWDDEEHILSGNDDAQVVLLHADGSTVTGVDFEADIARRVVRFLGPVSGHRMVER